MLQTLPVAVFTLGPLTGLVAVLRHHWYSDRPASLQSLLLAVFRHPEYGYQHVSLPVLPVAVLRHPECGDRHVSLPALPVALLRHPGLGDQHVALLPLPVAVLRHPGCGDRPAKRGCTSCLGQTLPANIFLILWLSKSVSKTSSKLKCY